jgi:hypothetical protein
MKKLMVESGWLIDGGEEEVDGGAGISAHQPSTLIDQLAVR